MVSSIFYVIYLHRDKKKNPRTITIETDKGATEGVGEMKNPVWLM